MNLLKKTRFIQRQHLLPADVKMTGNPPPPPPPPPKAPPPPSPPKAPPPPPPKAPPPPPPKGTPPPKKSPQRNPNKVPKSLRKPLPRKKAAERKPLPRKKAAERKPKKKKSRGPRLRLRIRSAKIDTEVDEYQDRLGWVTASSDLIPMEEEKKEPETMLHQCSMCGSRMTIPRPKRERYKVICSYPECGHEDMIGI